MTMFGINIPLESIQDETSQIDGYIDTVLKRNDERKVFKQFLEAKASEGRTVFEGFLMKSTQESKKSLESDLHVEENVLLEFAISRLKRKKGGTLSSYDRIVRKIIEHENPNFIQLHKRIDKGTFDGRIPFGYPNASKDAQNILIAKIKDSSLQIKAEYFKQKVLKEKLEEYAREMFHGINKLDLSGDKLVHYLGALLYLKSNQEAPPKGEQLIKSMIAESIIYDNKISVIYLKCLRLTYPKGKNLCLIDNPLDEKNLNVEDINGKTYVLPSEINFRSNLEKLTSEMQNQRVAIKPIVLIMDIDMYDLFVGDERFVPEEDVCTAIKKISSYQSVLKNEFGNSVHVDTVTQYLENNCLKEKFFDLKRGVLNSLQRGTSKMPESLVEERINYRFEGDKKIFGRGDRNTARLKVYNQISTEIALQVLLEESTFVISQSRGVENYYTAGAGNQYPVYFADLAEGNM